MSTPEGERIRADLALLEADLAEKTAEVASLTAANADLKAQLVECQEGSPPAPEPGSWVPPMKAVQVSYDWGEPDITLNPGVSIRDAFLAGKRNIRLLSGDYGSQALGVMPATKVHCDVYRGAKFANGSTAFALPAAGMVVGGMQVENYPMHNTKEGGAMLASDGVANQWFINMAVGKSKNNAYSIKGSKSGIRGGEIYEIARYGWAGGGTDNVFEDIFGKTIGTLAPEKSDVGMTKTVHSQRHTVRRICGIDVRWNGVWFDIGNDPALIEDIFFDGVGRASLFIEVSYGGENQTGDWKTWRIRRVGGANPLNVVRSTETGTILPAVVQISATSDLLVEDVYGTGWRYGVSLLNPQAHKQITGEIGTADRSRLGLQNITIVGQNTPGTIQAVAALTGRAHLDFPDMKQPTGIKWVDRKSNPGDKFRDFSGFVTEATFNSRYAA